MAEYNPKRPRPVETDEQTAPVDAFIGDAKPESAPPKAELNGKAPRSEAARPNGKPAPEVPVMPAPEEGTANRAVLSAVATGVLLGLIVLILVRLRRRSD